MIELAFGDWVRVRQASGETVGAVALAGPGGPDGERVVWVCDDHEWNISEREFRDPRGTAVPAANVIPSDPDAALPPGTPAEQFRALVADGRFAEAERLLGAIDVAQIADPHDPDLDPIGAFYEAWGDATRRVDADFADHVYDKAADRYGLFASWATAGGEGLARMISVEQLAAKRKR